jgi:hypothetical protein
MTDAAQWRKPTGRAATATGEPRRRPGLPWPILDHPLCGHAGHVLGGLRVNRGRRGSSAPCALVGEQTSYIGIEASESESPAAASGQCHRLTQAAELGPKGIRGERHLARRHRYADGSDHDQHPGRVSPFASFDRAKSRRWAMNRLAAKLACDDDVPLRGGVDRSMRVP